MSTNLNVPILWSSGRRKRNSWYGNAYIQVSKHFQDLEDLLMLSGRNLDTFCVRWPDQSAEHLSQAYVLSSGTLSPSCIPKAFLEFNPFISLKCCSEFRLSKRQSLGSDGEKTGNYGALLLLQAGPELCTVQMFKTHMPDSVIYLAFCRLNLSLVWKSSP